MFPLVVLNEEGDLWRICHLFLWLCRFLSHLRSSYARYLRSRGLLLLLNKLCHNIFYFPEISPLQKLVKDLHRCQSLRSSCPNIKQIPLSPIVQDLSLSYTEQSLSDAVAVLSKIFPLLHSFFNFCLLYRYRWAFLSEILFHELTKHISRFL